MDLLVRLSPIITIIVTVITLIAKNINKEYKSYLGLNKLYFEQLLVPYITHYRRDRNINPIRYIKKNNIHEKQFIPTYILYLIDEGKREELNKVLIVDYVNIFNSQINAFMGINYKIINLIKEIFFIFVFVYITTFLFFCLEKIISIISNYNIFNLDGAFNFLLMIVLSLIITIIFSILGLILMKYTIINSIREGDMYTNEKKFIYRQIKYKIKTYSKKSDKWYIN